MLFYILQALKTCELLKKQGANKLIKILRNININATQRERGK